MTQKIHRHLTVDVPCPTCGERAGKPCRVYTMRRRRNAAGNPRTTTVRWLHHARKAHA